MPFTWKKPDLFFMKSGVFLMEDKKKKTRKKLKIEKCDFYDFYFPIPLVLKFSGFKTAFFFRFSNFQFLMYFSGMFPILNPFFWGSFFLLMFKMYRFSIAYPLKLMNDDWRVKKDKKKQKKQKHANLYVFAYGSYGFILAVFYILNATKICKKKIRCN